MKIYGPVSLSTTMSNFFGYVNSQKHLEAQERVELGHAVDVIKSATIEQLNDGMKHCDGHETLDQDSLTELRQELEGLVHEWTNGYDLETLYEISGTGLKTHMRADEIQIQHGFEIEGPQGDGGSGVRKQWKRIENPLDNRVLAIVTYAYDGTRGKTEVFDGDAIVRPHSGGPRSDGHVGSEISTPEEVVERKQRWTDYRQASDLIEDRVEKHIKSIKGDEAKVALCYSVYPTDDRGVPIDNLDEIAIAGKAILVQESDYKDDEDEDFDNYESLAENPTWLDVCVLFNDAIQQTGDYHHIFLEGVHKTNKERDGVPIYRFSTGS